MQRCDPRAQPLVDAPGRSLPWCEVRDRIAAVRLAWFTSLHPDGHPHTRPVRTVWLGDRCFLASNPATRQARNVASRSTCSLAGAAADLDVTVEGRAVRIADDAVLAAVADAYERKYRWTVTVDVGALDTVDASPAGSPPFHVVEVVPRQVFAFDTTGRHGHGSARYTF